MEQKIWKDSFLSHFDSILEDVEKDDTVYVVCEDSACKQPSVVLMSMSRYDQMMKAYDWNAENIKFRNEY